MAAREAAIPEADGGTFQPNVPPTNHHAPPTEFTPLDLPERDFYVQPLPETPVGLFEEFLPPSLITKWVEYHEERTESDRRTHLTSVAELYCFFASLIYMGLHGENQIADYWCAKEGLDPKHTLSLFISKHRFWSLFRFFTFWDPDDENPTLPRLFSRVSEVSEAVKEASKRLIQIPLRVTIDESMVGFKGKSKVTTYIKGKPDPLGFKVWVIAAAGYILDWIWHFNHIGPVGIPYPSKALPEQTQRPRLPRNASIAEKALKQLNDTQQVVVTLLRRLPQQAYHLFCDNLFTSVALLLYLRTYMGIGMTATARERSGIYKPFADLRKKDAKKDDLPWNSIQRRATEDGKIQQFLYKGNVGVLFMSTVFSGLEGYIRQTVSRPRTKTAAAEFGDLQEKEVALPMIQHQYNHYKCGVDTANQLRSYNNWSHRVRRGREQCLFLQFILDVVLVNTFILQRDCQPERLGWKQYESQTAWRKDLSKAIFDKYGSQAKAGTRGYSGPNTFKKRPSEHQLIKRGKNSDCKACKGFKINSQNRAILGEIGPNTRVGRRSQTRYGCDECNVALCNSSSCWYLWHGQN